LRSNERGQVLILFVGVITILFVAAIMAIDYGFWLSERQGVARAADLGALAGAQDLPADATWPGPMNSKAVCDAPSPPPTDPPPVGWVAPDACVAAFDWAARNGYKDDDEGGSADVEVSFFCGNQLPEAIVDRIDSVNDTQQVCLNENCQDPSSPRCQEFPLSPCPSAGQEGVEKGCDAMSVTINKTAVNLFSNFFGGVDFKVGFGSFSSVTFKLLPTDSAVIIDRSGSMGDSPCSGANGQTGCKIHEAKSAANNFVDQLVTGSGNTKAGFAAYSGCYNPPLNNAVCVPRPGDPLTPANCNLVGTYQVACLNAAVANTHTLINNTQPNGTTNICLGLKQGQKILAGPGNQNVVGSPDYDPATKRFIVLLTDGANVWDATTAAGVDAACVPTGVTGGSTACNTMRVLNDINAQLDVKTLQLATLLKANTEIFTVQVYDNSCVPPNATYTPPQCNTQVGNRDPVRIASARLLQCIATTPEKNDHYFKTNDATTLGDIFTKVAYEIASRGLSVGPP
jgi:hypothetical protein